MVFYAAANFTPYQKLVDKESSLTRINSANFCLRRWSRYKNTIKNIARQHFVCNTILYAGLTNDQRGTVRSDNSRHEQGATISQQQIAGVSNPSSWVPSKGTNRLPSLRRLQGMVATWDNDGLDSKGTSVEWMMMMNQVIRWHNNDFFALG